MNTDEKNIVKEKKLNNEMQKQENISDYNVDEIPLEEQLERSKDEINNMKEACDSMKDEVLRAKAEMENIRRRAEKEVSNVRKFGIEKFVKEILPVVDSINQAIKHEAKLDEAIAIQEGIKLTAKMIVDILKNNGLEELDPKGEKFYPDMHEAITTIPNSKLENNTISEVFQKGYLLNGRVVRAAKVIIVKND